MEIDIVRKEKFYVTTRKMQSTQDCVRDYLIEDYHPTLAIAKECMVEYNKCFSLPPREVTNTIEKLIIKYKLKGSAYDSGKMLNDVYVMVIKRTYIALD